MFFLKLMFLILFLNSSLLSNTETNRLSEEELNKQLEVEALLKGEDTTLIHGDSNKSGQKTSSFKDNDDTYRDIALYNLITRYGTDNNIKNYNISSKENINFLADNVGIHTKKLQDEEAKRKAEQKAKDDEENEIRILSFSGYCSIRNTIEVDAIQGYSLLDCELNDNELGLASTKVMAMFTPITSRNALIGKPIYILDTNNKKMPIQSGVILTADGTSLNLANFINDKKLKRLTGDILGQTGDIMINQSVAYLNQLEESKKKEEIIINNSVSGTTQSKATNTEAPDVTTYLVHSGIQLFSGLFKLGGLLLSEDKYPLFRVDARSEFYLDFVVEINGNKDKSKDTKESERIKYENKSYEEHNKPVSIGEEIPQQKIQLPTSALGN